MLSKLIEKYNIEVQSPFTLIVKNKKHTFQCLIKGYGAPNGMIVDEDYSKIEPISNYLINLGYGYSCFEILCPSNIEGFQEVLDDWGKI